MGANGAGKTTLFNLLTGFTRPASGEIFLDSVSIVNLKPYQRSRAGISRAFQDLRLINTMTIEENLLLAIGGDPTDSWPRALLTPFFRARVRVQLRLRVEQTLEEYGLTDVARNLCSDVSYGQQKLVTLACAANAGGLLLLDEPVASVSPGHIHSITMLLRKLRAKGATILLIEHNSDFVRDIADRILFLSDGRLREYDTYDALKADPFLAD
jgi:branched-chain amino acid transport system ATP-binding protein